jgi:glutaredoxin-like protein NrdH
MITVYSNPNCVQCETTKRYLKQRGVPFEEKMIKDSPEVLPIIEANGYTTAPVVVTDTGSWSGFRITKLAEYVMAS